MLKRSVFVVTALVILAVLSVAQTNQAESDRIEQFMSAASLRKTGIAQLVPLERKALNDWLASHRSLLGSAAFGDAASPGAPSQHEAFYAVHIEALMTPTELQDSGLVRLRPKQHKALNDWLSSHISQSRQLLPERGSRREFELQTEILRAAYPTPEQVRQEKAEDIKAAESARLEAQQKYRVTVVSITSTPAGAEIEVDGAFLGNTPAELPLVPGQRGIRLSKKGYRAYQRTVEVLPGGTQRVAVELEHE